MRHSEGLECSIIMFLCYTSTVQFIVRFMCIEVDILFPNYMYVYLFKRMMFQK